MRVAKDFRLRTLEAPEGPPGAETIVLWDFDVAIPGGHKKNPYRKTYPFAQLKNDMVAQSRKRTNSEQSGRGFFKWLRAQYAEIVNTVLEQHGADFHYDPRSYEDMGVGWAPTKHLGPKQAALEAEGIATVDGSRNAILRYRSLENDLEKERNRRLKAAKEAQADAVKRYDQYRAPLGLSGLVVMEANVRTILEEQQARDEWALALFDLRRTAVESRALFLDAAPYQIQAKRTQRQLSARQQRARPAGEFLDEVYEALQPFERDLEELKRECAERQIQIHSTTENIERLIASAAFSDQSRLASIPGWSEETVQAPKVLPPSKAQPAVPGPGKLPIAPAQPGSTAAPHAETRPLVTKKTSPSASPSQYASEPHNQAGATKATVKPELIIDVLKEPEVPQERLGRLRPDGSVEKIEEGHPSAPAASTVPPAERSIRQPPQPPTASGTSAESAAKADSAAPPEPVDAAPAAPRQEPQPTGDGARESERPAPEPVSVPAAKPDAQPVAAASRNPAEGRLIDRPAREENDEKKVADITAGAGAPSEPISTHDPAPARDTVEGEQANAEAGHPADQSQPTLSPEYCESIFAQLVQPLDPFVVRFNAETRAYEVVNPPADWVPYLQSPARAEETQLRLQVVYESRHVAEMVLDAFKSGDPTRYEITPDAIRFPKLTPEDQARLERYREWPNVADAIDTIRELHGAWPREEGYTPAEQAWSKRGSGQGMD